MKKYDNDAWAELGRYVRHARLRAGYKETQPWAAKVGRSSRVVLGLERGEPQGQGTLERVAAALEWPMDLPIRILENPQHYRPLDDGRYADEHWADHRDYVMGQASELAESVGASVDDPGTATIKARKPANMSDEDFKRLLTEYEEELEWKLNRAAREHP